MTENSSASLRPGEAGSVWCGAIQWRTEGSWFTPWRLNPDDPGLAELPELCTLAKAGAGVRAAFESDARHLRLRIDRPGAATDAAPGAVDLLIDGVLTERVDVHAGDQTLEFDLAAGVKQIELWLPQAEPTRVGSLEAHGASFLRPSGADRPRWIAYGSSITQCYEASGPSDTWPSVVARTLDWHLTCLGFSGQCFLDAPVARTIRDTAADVISICAGINIYGRGTWGAGEFSAALTQFLTTVLSTHPHAAVWLMSPVISPSREDVVNAAGLTLRDMRSIIRAVSTTFQSRGVRHVDGLSVLGPGDEVLLHDGLHPDATGYLTMAQRLSSVLGSEEAPRLPG